MRRLLGLALVPALLFGCAAKDIQPTQPKEVAQAEACSTVTATALRENMAKEAAVEFKADLEGEPFEEFVNWISPHLSNPIPAGVDRVMIFEKEGVALVVWLKQGCAVAHLVGPWAPIKQFLGVPI